MDILLLLFPTTIAVFAGSFLCTAVFDLFDLDTVIEQFILVDKIGLLHLLEGVAEPEFHEGLLVMAEDSIWVLRIGKVGGRQPSSAGR